MRGQKKKKEIYDACTLLVSMDRYFAAEIALPGMILGTYISMTRRALLLCFFRAFTILQSMCISISLIAGEKRMFFR